MADNETRPTIRTVTVSRAAKINLGNFENTDVSVTLTAEVADGTEASETAQALFDEATAYLRQEAARIEKAAAKYDGYKRY